ncbi:hypothetical protein LRS03_22865 [Rhizobacter sp. J219]|uniref:hypothetical protein n=1 Tax=Rhizobacter sp. J219 TaxID=2898430 RepID=UPI0021516629|nr:hypothetical protein [Rhizobacter sp. J219]MCR5885545.1 hypothetical protein [Rhizobacter sp. J219]
MSRSEIALEAPRRRRRLGLWLIALGLTLIAAQSFWEWQLPYDVMALQRAQAVLGLDELQPQTMALAWGGVCALALLLLHRAPGARQRCWRGWRSAARGWRRVGPLPRCWCCCSPAWPASAGSPGARVGWRCCWARP